MRRTRVAYLGAEEELRELLLDILHETGFDAFVSAPERDLLLRMAAWGPDVLVIGDDRCQGTPSSTSDLAAADPRLASIPRILIGCGLDDVPVEGARSIGSWALRIPFSLQELTELIVRVTEDPASPSRTDGRSAHP